MSADEDTHLHCNCSLRCQSVSLPSTRVEYVCLMRGSQQAGGLMGLDIRQFTGPSAYLLSSPVWWWKVSLVVKQKLL
jgi:hypothetical protein